MLFYDKLNESLKVDQVLKIDPSNKVDHISFEIFPDGGYIQAFFMDKSNNEVEPYSVSCGREADIGKKLFNSEDGKTDDKIMKELVKRLKSSGLDKIKIKKYVMIHDTSKKYTI